MPDVVGMDEEDAREALEAAGFEVGEVTTDESDEDEGTVIRQSREAENKLKRERPLISL